LGREDESMTMMGKKATRRFKGARSKRRFGPPIARRKLVGYRRPGLLSYKSPQSVLSVFSVGSLLSFVSILSIGSAGSILSIGSSGSILSIGSAGSILSIGSVGSILSIGCAGTVLNKAREERDEEDEGES
jgi:hypothetical protein